MSPEPLSNQPPPTFLYRGNVFASSGYLTKLDNIPVNLTPDIVTVHGESSLPTIGGVSHSVIEKPKLPFPDWIQYGRCETFAQGSGGASTKTTQLHASVQDVRIMTRPSPEDGVSGVIHTSFEADQLSLAVESVHPSQGQSSFKLVDQPKTTNLRLIQTFKFARTIQRKVELEYEHTLMAGETLDEVEARFKKDRDFFNQFALRLKASSPLKFGDSLPRTDDGYIISSIVKAVIIDGKLYQSSFYREPGFGTIYFGQMLASGSSRRISLVTVKMGSDPAGNTSHGGADTNGVWN